MAEPLAETPTRRGVRVVVGVVLALALAVGVGIASRGTVESDAGFTVGRAAGSSHQPALSVTPVTVPPLPIPEALPDNPYEDTPQVVVGTIEIPKIGITADMQRGMALTAINRGPGWWPGTAMPGELGNVVIAGHRTTYSKPFNRLNELAPGDQVIFTTDAGRFVYGVRDIMVVPETWIDIAAQSYAHTATLFACHPPGSSASGSWRNCGSSTRTVNRSIPMRRCRPSMPKRRTPNTPFSVRDRTDVGSTSGTGVNPLAGSEG